MPGREIQHSLKSHGKVVNYWLVRTSRKSSVGIKITSQGVFVYAPKRACLADIKRILLANLDWITETLDKRQSAKKHFVDGEVFQYLGKDLALSVKTSARATRITIARTPRRLVVHGPAGIGPDAIRKALLDWYRGEARAVIPARVSFWANKMGLRHGRISIKDQRTKWASCSLRGNLNFSLRIVMMPEKIIDYLVVHELSHIRIPKHPKAFWELVGFFTPDYRESERWLKENGWRLRW